MTAVPTTPLPSTLPADQKLVVPVGWDPGGAKFVPFLAQPIFYQAVAASQTGAILSPSGPTAGGAAGDLIAGVLVIPAAVGAGNISLIDGTTSISIFVTGTLADLKPFFIPLGVISKTGAWSITTGGSVSVIAMGRFT